MPAKNTIALIGLAMGLSSSWMAADEPLPPRAVVVSELSLPPGVVVSESNPAAESDWEPPAGCFGAIDSQVLFPHLKYRLPALMDFGSLGTDVVNLPAAPLDGVVAPRLELGYRFPDGLGGFIASYRPLTSRGDATLLGFGVAGEAPLHTRLDMHVLDLDWASKEWLVAESFRFQWRLGARLATMFADSQAADGVIAQRSNDFFYGIGPHVGADLWAQLPWPGMGLFVRAEAASLGGEIKQSFEEVVVTAGGPAGAVTEFRHTNSVPVVSFQAGLSWSSGIFAPENVTFSAGYAYEHWWYLGSLTGNITDNRVSLWSQGVFIRGEWRY
jgi:hypothetical protein